MTIVYVFINERTWPCADDLCACRLAESVQCFVELVNAPPWGHDLAYTGWSSEAALRLSLGFIAVTIVGSVCCRSLGTLVVVRSTSYAAETAASNRS